MEYKKLSLIVIATLALAVYVLPINEWTSQVTAQSNEGDDGETQDTISESESEIESESETGTTEQDDETAEEDELEETEADEEDKLKDGDPDANNGNGNDAKDDEDEDDPDGNPNNREGTPGTERCLERSNGNCANSPVHDGYGDTSEDEADIE